MSHRIQFKQVAAKLLAVGLLSGVFGCAHIHEQREAFRAESFKAIPSARLFASRSLKKPTDENLRILESTEPEVDHIRAFT